MAGRMPLGGWGDQGLALCGRAGTILTHPTLRLFGNLFEIEPSTIIPTWEDTPVPEITEKSVRWRLLRNTAMVAVVASAALVAGCAQEQPGPPPQPVAEAPPPPPPAPPPAPAPVIGERG